MGDRWQAARAVLEGAVEQGLTPGASALVGRGDEILVELCVGTLGLAGEDPRVDEATLYDLSSLTKPLATAACAMALIAEGQLRLDTRVCELLPDFTEGEAADIRRRVRIGDLMGHRSGLPAWLPLHDAVSGQAPGGESARRAVCRAALAAPLEAGPGERAVYSDVGFVVLGLALEQTAGARLDELVRRVLLEPLALVATSFRALASLAGASRVVDVQPSAQRIAPCGKSISRGTPVHGVVHDDNAFAMGGVAGHAGLFSTARDVHRIAAEHVAAAADRGRVLDRGVLESCWSASARLAGSSWTLGWDTPSQPGSSAGRLVSEDAVGHLGFTGTSLWIDRRRGVHVVLLTNRLQSGTEREAVQALRARFHDAVFAAADGC